MRRKHFSFALLAVLLSFVSPAFAQVAKIGDTEYTTLEAAYTAANASETITLLEDLNMSEILTINKAITLDGNSKTLTSTAGRAINVSGAAGVTIKNLTINASGERAINVIQNATNVTIDNVTATAANYTVNIAGSAPNAVVAIKNSTLNGLCTVNVAAAGAKVTVDNSTVNCNDNNTTEGESYAALSLNKEAVGGSIVATNSTINVADGSDSMKGRNGAENGTVTIDGSTDGVAVMVAVITYEGQPSYHAFASLAKAVEFAKAGDVITLIRDITSSEIITIDKAITIDLGDKKVTANCRKAFEVYANTTIKNGTIEALNRCVDTRKAVELTLEEVTLVADNYTTAYGNPQPLTIGGYDHGTKLTINNSTISAKAGYGIISFVKTEATISNSTIGGYNAYYAKEGSNGSVFNFVKSTLTGDCTGNDVEGNSFSAIAIQEDGVTVNVDATSTVVAKGNNMYAIGVGKQDTPDHEGVSVTVAGTITGNVFAGKINSNAIVVRADYAEALNAKGYATVATSNGLVALKSAAAKIVSTPYATLAEAVAAAQAGETVTLLADLNMSEILVLDKAITLDGNGKTLTSTAGRAINVSGADGVTIKNLTINASGERAINVIQNATNVTIDNVTATAANYTVNLATSAPNAVVAINNSTLNGLCTVNVSAAGARVTVDNSTVNCNDNNTTEGESYAALSLNKEAVGGSIVATNTTVNVVEGSDSNKGRNGAEDGAVTINGSTDDVTIMVAAITYEGSPYYYSFTSVTEAIEFAKASDKITLIRDITSSAAIVIDKTITLDLNGKTITGTPAEAKAYAVITNTGDLTITGNGAIICNHTLAGSTGYAVNTITNCGKLTIDGATIENKSTAQLQIGYAIDNNSTSTDAIVNIKGGKVSASGSLYYDGIRLFCNSETKENSVVVSGGEVSTIWMQNPSDGATKNTKDVKGSVAIEGGKVGVLSLEPSASFEAAVTGGHINEISYFQTSEGRDLVEFVSGGTFGMDVTAFCAEGFIVKANADGTFGIVDASTYEIIIDHNAYNGSAFTNENDITVKTLTYTRQLNSVNTWNALYVPFEIEVTEDFLNLYTVAYFNDIHSFDENFDGEIDRMTTEFIHVRLGQTLKANYPYIIKAKSEEALTMNLSYNEATLYKAVETTISCSSVFMLFELTGNYTTKTAGELAEDGKYTVWGMADSGNFATAETEDQKLNPFRIYLRASSIDGSPVKVSEAALRSISINVVGEEPTADEAESPVENNFIYDVLGRRVLEPQKGVLYIINGEKVIF